jgi:uncharacterized radical SAM superfamily protein
MVPIEKAAEALAKGDYTSCLLSGGCTADGAVDYAPYWDELKKLKGNRRYNLHVGLMKPQDIEHLEGLADQISFDLVGDDETVKEVFGLDAGAAAYFDQYERLQKIAPVTPHICIGIKGGSLSGEWRALEYFEQHQPRALVFIVFIPTPHTVYADRKPPAIDEVIDFMARARACLPHTVLQLGCMRPAGSYRMELDEAFVRLGGNAIVSPTPDARNAALELELTPEYSQECCVL